MRAVSSSAAAVRCCLARGNALRSAGPPGVTESTLKISCSSCRKTIPTPAAVQRPHTAASVPTSRPCLPVPCARDTCRVFKTHSQLRLPHQDDASAGRWRSRFERRTAVPEFRALPSRPARRDQPGRWSPAVQNRSTAGGVNRRVRTGASERAQQTRRRACQRQRRLGPSASARVRPRACAPGAGGRDTDPQGAFRGIDPPLHAPAVLPFCAAHRCAGVPLPPPRHAPTPRPRRKYR